jgi:hypothetical protein
MGKKGQKSQRGQPDNDWGEVKSAPVNHRMTLTGRNKLKDLAALYHLSIGDLMERVARMLSPFKPSPVSEPLRCKSLSQLTIKYWQYLASYERLPLERLQQFRDGEDLPTELEICRIALVLGVWESEIEEVIQRGRNGAERLHTEVVED